MTCKNPYIIGRCDEIDRLIADALKWSDTDPKLGAHLAAYISVLIVGIFEDCIENLVAVRVKKANDPEIHNYITRIIDQRFRNPDYQKISTMLFDFSDEYRASFKSKITPNGKEADSLQSLVDNKNALAHTGIASLTLTIGDVQSYYQHSMIILQELEQILCNA